MNHSKMFRLTLSVPSSARPSLVLITPRSSTSIRSTTSVGTPVSAATFLTRFRSENVSFNVVSAFECTPFSCVNHPSIEHQYPVDDVGWDSSFCGHLLNALPFLLRPCFLGEVRTQGDDTVEASVLVRTSDRTMTASWSEPLITERLQSTQ